jgi:acyl-CoA thioesterase I
MHKRRWSNIAGLGALALTLGACSGEAEEAARSPDVAEDGQPTLPAIPVMGPERRIVAFGDSLFAGYGLDPAQSYPARLEAALRVNGVNAAITNSGVSGDTTAAGLQRLAFTLDAQSAKPDLFILELGGNDLLRGLEPEETKANLGKMLDELKARGIPVLLMGMRSPPNYGPEYGADLIPFWLADIYREPELFQSDRIHPTAEGIERLVASTLDEVEGALPATEEP